MLSPLAGVARRAGGIIAGTFSDHDDLIRVRFRLQRD